MTLQEQTRVKVICPAKLNLTFEILGRMPDGYHEVRTVLQAISLQDEIEFIFAKADSVADESARERYEIIGEIHGDFPLDERNLISKAIRLYRSSMREAGLFEVRIRVRKNIPIGAGLAGGSANAAAALLAMNLLHDNKLSMNELLELGATLGADVPFSLTGGTSLGTNKGDILQPVANHSRCAFLLAKPRHLQISTPWAYKQFDIVKEMNQDVSAAFELFHNLPVDASPESGSQRGKDRTSACIDALSRGDTPGLAELCSNDLEPIVMTEQSALSSLRNYIEVECGAKCRMTGSGPTLFTIFSDIDQAERARERLGKKFHGCTDKFERCEDDQKRIRQNQWQALLPVDLYVARCADQGAHVTHFNGRIVKSISHTLKD